LAYWALGQNTAEIGCTAEHWHGGLGVRRGPRLVG
jgi:hypothetical protein